MGKEILCDNRYPVVFIIFDARFDSKVKGKDRLKITPSFRNPYTDEMVYFVICPSHQVC